MKFRVLLTLMLSTVVIQQTQAVEAGYKSAVGDQVVPINTVSGYDWSGLYISGSGALHQDYYTDSAASVSAAQTKEYRQGLAIAGAVGYNFTMKNYFLLGLELDSSYNAFKQVIKPEVASLSKTALVVVDQFNNSLRLRAGFTFNRFLVYTTGGVSLGNLSARANVWDAEAVYPKEADKDKADESPDGKEKKDAKNVKANDADEPDSAPEPTPSKPQPIINKGETILGDMQNTWVLGWNVGGGVEYAVADNLTVRLEYRFNRAKAFSDINVQAKQKKQEGDDKQKKQEGDDTKATMDLEYTTPVKMNIVSHAVSLGVVYRF